MTLDDTHPEINDLRSAPDTMHCGSSLWPNPAVSVEQKTVFAKIPRQISMFRYGRNHGIAMDTGHVYPECDTIIISFQLANS